uniref:Putative DNA-directed RNA polymerase II n=1 Tax=Trypanosoma congolense (strain IL3000) TaxID=1068625 RepID=G0UY95_TRYCI|nr:putative DNA-directed RNA polymerase II [Trypanosoma congolense IL3000]
MNSIQDFKIIRLYRAFNTSLQMCIDRGYTVRHPSIVAEAIMNKKYYSDVDGLDYDWFKQHFIKGRESAKSEKCASETDVSKSEPGNRDNLPWLPYSVICKSLTLRCQLIKEQSEVDNEPGLEQDRKVSKHEDGKAGVNLVNKKKISLFVFFTPALNLKELHEFREWALVKGAGSMIVVSGSKVPASVRRIARGLSGLLRSETSERLLGIQIFEEEELSYNITRHSSVPKHVVLTPCEAKEFLQNWKLTPTQLPRILDSDPIVGYLNLERGSIIRIDRVDPEGGPYQMYRQVM